MNAFLPAAAAESLDEPESDQQIRRQAHAFPADKHQQVVAGQNQRQHEEHEQVQVAEEAVEAAFLPHVADRIDVIRKPTPVTTSSMTSESWSR